MKLEDVIVWCSTVFVSSTYQLFYILMIWAILDHDQLFYLAYEKVKVDESRLQAHLWTFRQQINLNHLQITIQSADAKEIPVLDAFLQAVSVCKNIIVASSFGIFLTHIYCTIGWAEYNIKAFRKWVSTRVVWRSSCWEIWHYCDYFQFKLRSSYWIGITFS